MPSRRRERWKTILPTATLTVIPFVAQVPVASAFFPPVVPPGTAPPVGVPPVAPPPFVPPVVPPVIVPPVTPPPVHGHPNPCCCYCPPPPPCGVPEPATIVSSLLGFAAFAGYRGTRR